MTNQQEIAALQEQLHKTVEGFFLEAGTASTIASYEAFVNEAALHSNIPLKDMGEPLFDMFRTMRLIARLSEINERIDLYQRQLIQSQSKSE